MISWYNKNRDKTFAVGFDFIVDKLIFQVLCDFNFSIKEQKKKVYIQMKFNFKMQINLVTFNDIYINLKYEIIFFSSMNTGLLK